MSARIRKDLSDKSCNVIQVGPWYLSVNRNTKQCQVTSGDIWFPLSRSEAAQLLLRKVG